MRNHPYFQWMAAATETVLWHDSTIASEQEDSLTNGIVGMTTNPYLIQATLNKDKEFWQEKLKALPHFDDQDEKAEALTGLVVDYFLEAFEGFYGKTPWGGYVCAQLNPFKSGDKEYSMAQMRRYAGRSKRLVVKIPATRAGLATLEEAIALGYNATSTCSLTVPQAVEAGAAIERGKKRAQAAGITPGLGTVVMQPGRLDDYIRDAAHDQGADVSEEDILQGGIACVKNAYRIFAERGYDAPLLIAGFRNFRQITELAGARMILTLPPAWVEAVPVDQPKEERIDIPVPQDVIDRLLTVNEFRRAYLEDGMKPEEFITHGAYNRTIDQLQNDGWGILRNM